METNPDQVPKEAEQSPPRPRRPRRRWLWRAAIALVVMLVGAELFLRFAWPGLGDPPLSMADPEIEYLFKPNQECRRAGHFLHRNRIHYNQWSMRSDDFPQHKADPRELRVLVLGDSVINGGALTDQSEIATEILKRELSAKLGRPVVVGNVSAASWGPPNLLAYVKAKRFGWFDADVVVIVLSSHDYADVPTFEPVVGVDLNYPDRKPVLAIQEAWSRYLWPRIAGAASADASMPSEKPPRPQDIEQSLSAVRELVRRAKSRDVPVIVALHLEPVEIGGHVKPGHDMIEHAAEESGATVVQLGPAEEASLRAGKNPWRDTVHPNAQGQRVIADVLREAILDSLKSKIPTTNEHE